MIITLILFTVDLVSIIKENTLIYKNNQNHTFSIPSESLVGIGSGYGDWADLNLDGFQDIILAGTENHKLVTYLNFGDDSLKLAIINQIPTISDAYISAVDYNNNQKVDIGVTGNDSLGTSTILLNEESTFTALSRLSNGENLKGLIQKPSLSWGDFDANGTLDLLATGLLNQEDNNSQTVGPQTIIYRNEGSDKLFELILRDPLNGLKKW